jgi:hypothetical protein
MPSSCAAESWLSTQLRRIARMAARDRIRGLSTYSSDAAHTPASQ